MSDSGEVSHPSLCHKRIVRHSSLTRTVHSLITNKKYKKMASRTALHEAFIHTTLCAVGEIQAHLGESSAESSFFLFPMRHGAAAAAAAWSVSACPCARLCTQSSRRASREDQDAALFCSGPRVQAWYRYLRQCQNIKRLEGLCLHYGSARMISSRGE